MSTRIPKRRGRPPKNRDMDLRIESDNFNYNKKNIFPPNTININPDYKKRTLDAGGNVQAMLKFNKAVIFNVLIDIFKGKDNKIYMIFKEDGLLFNQSLISIKKDITRFECKLYADRFIDYAIIAGTTAIGIQVDVEKISNVLKTIPKNHEFIMKVTKVGGSVYLIIEYIIANVGNGTRCIIKLDDLAAYASMKASYTIKDYDIIFIMDSKEFQRICQNVINRNSEIIEITYIYDHDRNEIQFSCYDDGVTINSVSYPSKKTVVLKSVRSSTQTSGIVSGKYNLSAFIKYTKCKAISTIVKLYLSNRCPLILEYDIDPKLGTLQMFVTQRALL